MSPFAYGIRDQHEVFHHPHQIHTQATIEYDTPAAFKKKIEGEKIKVLPLVTDQAARTFPGWCSYAGQLSESPDIEIMCGGVNSKAFDAAGLWRQGHLMHYGFDLEPSEMNDAAKHLLVNSIHYISRFREDRAILISPSPFAGGRARSRESVGAYLDNSDYPVDWFTGQFVEGTTPKTEDRAELKKWFAKVEGALCPKGGQLIVDPAALELGLRNDDPKFLAAVLKGGNRELFLRYAPEFAKFEPETWSRQLAKLEDKMFFSDWGGYRWYLDPLAVKLGIPTTELRGAKRALEEKSGVGMRGK